MLERARKAGHVYAPDGWGSTTGLSAWLPSDDGCFAGLSVRRLRGP